MCKLQGRSFSIHGPADQPRRVMVTASWIKEPSVIIHLEKGSTLGMTPEEADQLVLDLKEALKALREV